jgi:hypothetical protein
MGAHRSRVYELVEKTPGHWDFSNAAGMIFASGNTHVPLTHPDSYINEKNAVGGISYSNSSLGTDNAMNCDDAVWMSSDIIYFSTLAPAPATQSGLTYVYGLQAMKKTGGNEKTAINIDLDDNYASHDKWHLGDVEVYKSPLNCNACSCGSWEGAPTFKGEPIKGVPATRLPDDIAQARINGTVRPKEEAQLLKYYPLQFVQGQVNGVIAATYLCNGHCGASYSWSLTGKNGAIAVGTRNPANALDLADLNSKLMCGQYTLTLKAFCGGSNCGSYIIPITIICEPPSCCVAQVDAKLAEVGINTQTNVPNPNALSAGSFMYNLTYSLPMSEIRASIEEFRLVSASPNCINESNTPSTWANIVSASLNGTAMALSGMVGGSPGSGLQYRNATGPVISNYKTPAFLTCCHRTAML